MTKAEFGLVREALKGDPDFWCWLMRVPGDILIPEKEAVLTAITAAYVSPIYISTGRGDVGRLGSHNQFTMFNEYSNHLSVTKAMEKLSEYMKDGATRTIILDISSETELPYSVAKGLRRIVNKVKNTRRDKRILLILNEECRFDPNSYDDIFRYDTIWRFPERLNVCCTDTLLKYLWSRRLELFRRIMNDYKVTEKPFTKRPVNYLIDGVPAGLLDLECKVLDEEPVDDVDELGAVKYEDADKDIFKNTDVVLYKVNGKWNRPEWALASMKYKIPVWYVDISKYVE